MDRPLTIPRLLWISPGRGCGDALQRQLAACLDAGLPGFQLREPMSFALDLWNFLVRMRKHPRAEELCIVVNDRVDLALAMGLAGVQVGKRSMPWTEVRALLGPERLLGASIHDEAELARAVEAGADYVLASPVHPVRKAGRPSGAPLGLLGLEALVRQAPIPVLALGGVTPERVPQILATGVHGVAAMSGIGDAADPGAAVAAYLEALT